MWKTEHIPAESHARSTDLLQTKPVNVALGTHLSGHVAQRVQSQLSERDEVTVGTEQKEAQARSVGRQQLDVGLLEGEVSQDDGDLQHSLGLRVAGAWVPRRMEEALPVLLPGRTICDHNTGGDALIKLRGL